MFNTPISKYFWEINVYNIPIAIVFGFSAGLVYGLIIFCSVGIFLGLLSFKYFKNNEYYMYYNLGFTKNTLLKKIFIRNLIIASLIFISVIITK